MDVMGPDETVCAVVTDDKTDGGGITPRLLNQPVGDNIDVWCGGRYGYLCEQKKTHQESIDQHMRHKHK